MYILYTRRCGIWLYSRIKAIGYHTDYI